MTKSRICFLSTFYLQYESEIIHRNGIENQLNMFLVNATWECIYVYRRPDCRRYCLILQGNYDFTVFVACSICWSLRLSGEQHCLHRIYLMQSWMANLKIHSHWPWVMPWEVLRRQHYYRQRKKMDSEKVRQIYANNGDKFVRISFYF